MGQQATSLSGGCSSCSDCPGCSSCPNCSGRGGRCPSGGGAAAQRRLNAQFKMLAGGNDNEDEKKLSPNSLLIVTTENCSFCADQKKVLDNIKNIQIRTIDIAEFNEVYKYYVINAFPNYVIKAFPTTLYLKDNKIGNKILSVAGVGVQNENKLNKLLLSKIQND